MCAPLALSFPTRGSSHLPWTAILNLYLFPKAPSLAPNSQSRKWTPVLKERKKESGWAGSREGSASAGSRSSLWGEGNWWGLLKKNRKKKKPHTQKSDERGNKFGCLKPIPSTHLQAQRERKHIFSTVTFPETNVQQAMLWILKTSLSIPTLVVLETYMVYISTPLLLT